jgi:hypothetical protein
VKENLTQYSQLEEERFELQGELVLIGQNVFLAELRRTIRFVYGSVLIDLGT